jgi:hypothetical protein
LERIGGKKTVIDGCLWEKFGGRGGEEVGGGGGEKYCAGANAIVAIGQIQFGDWDYSPDDRDVIFRPSFEIMGKFA